MKKVDAADGDPERPTTLLRAAECARRLGVSRATVFRLLREGRLRSVVLGKERRIPVVALDEFVAA